MSEEIKLFFLFFILALIVLLGLRPGGYLRIVYLIPVSGLSTIFPFKLTYFGTELSVNSFLYIYIILIGLIHIIRLSSQLLIILSKFKLYIFFLLWIVLSYIAAKERVPFGDFFKFFLLFVTPLIVGMVSYANYIYIKLPQMLYNAFFFFLLLIIIGLPFNLTRFEFTEIGRFYGLHSDLTSGPRIYAPFLAIIYFYILSKVNVIKKISFKEMIVLFVLVTFLILSGSRTTIFSAMIITIYATFRRKTFLGVVIVIFLLTIFYLFKDIFVQRMFYSDKIISIENLDTTGRAFMWEILLTKILSNLDFVRLILGFGANSSMHYLKETLNTPYTIHPHNDYIRLIYDYGFIGLVSYYYFFLSFLRISFKENFKLKGDIDSLVLLKFTKYLIVFLLFLSFTDNFIVYALAFQNILFSIIAKFWRENIQKIY